MSRPGLSVAILSVGLVLMMVMGCLIGSVDIPLGEALSVLLGGEGADPMYAIILRELRAARVVMAALIGAALAIAGVVLQGLLRNPLADPYVLGVSSGGALGAAAALALGFDLGFLGVGGPAIAAFIGSFIALLVVITVGQVRGQLSVDGVLLAGIAVGLLGAAGLSMTLFVAEEQAGDIVLWLMGHLGGSTWTEVAWVAGCVLIGVILVAPMTTALDVMLQGETTARHLGVAVESLKWRILGASALLVAGAVAFCGIIGFVGLVVPHGIRFIVGPSHRWLLPASALGGALLLVGADLLARTVLPDTELPVGIVTGLLGGPFFLLILRRRLIHAAA